MAESAVTFVVNQLATILREERDLLGGLHEKMEWIRRELEHMKAFLRVADSMENDDEEVKEWVKQVTDAAFDTEKVLDEFKLHFEHSLAHEFCSPLCKVSRWVKTVKFRHGIASETRSIKSKITHISDAFRRYGYKFAVGGHGGSSLFSGNSDPYDRRGDALLIEEAELVGIEEPKRQLVGWILKGDSRLNVVSVVGMGGLGKTTLIKKVYDDLEVKKHFQSHAWISVSQSFKLEKLLKDIIQQLFDERNESVPERLGNMNRDELKKTMKSFLSDRRYVIVLDDVWSISDWDGFKYALPNNDLGSRVMLTTRVQEVAYTSSSESPDRVYILKSLSARQAMTLFCNKTFPKSTCPSYLEKLSKSILKKCEGLPLAIVAIGGVLSTKDSSKEDEWEMVDQCLDFEGNERFKSTRKILSLGYIDLPYYLKSCFLYLSIFPTDYLIERKRLIRLWMAEGFVEEKQGKTQEEVADGYLNELLNRSMIEVAEQTIDGKVKTCRIHDLIREIILSKSKEQIFVAANEPKLRVPEKIRCISIHDNIENVQQIKSPVSQLRSLLMFGLGGSLSNLSMPSFFGTNLKLLRVLDLTGAPLEIFPEDIVQLINLRYLSLRNTKVRKLPNSIGNLRNLETLDLKGAYITNLPVKILKLNRLRHLLVYRYNDTFSYNERYAFPSPSVYGFKAPSGIGKLSSLQKLNFMEANEESGILIQEIGKLSQLRRLGLTKLRKEDGETLCSSIGKLCNLGSLSLESIQEHEIIDLQYLSSPPRYIRCLRLVGRLEKLPHWICLARSLVKVCLRKSQLKEDPLESLGALPNLVSLGLFMAYDGEKMCFKDRKFPRLKELWLENLEELKMVIVEVGAMPKLERLHIWRCKLLERVPSGILKLTNLEFLQLWDMSDKLIETLNPNQAGNACWIIAHILRIQILYYTEDGHLKGYNYEK